MPVFRSGKGNAPAWCEMEDFELVPLARGQTQRFKRIGRKEHFLVCHGTARITDGTTYRALQQGAKLNVDDDVKELVVEAGDEDTLIFRAIGRWESVRGSGLFTVRTDAI